MTATVPTILTPSRRGTATVLRRALAAEWTRLVSLRSTWWCLAAGAGLMLFVAVAAGASHDGAEVAPIWVPAQIATVPAQFAYLSLVLLAVTGEYATGAIRSTLQWLPQRGIVLVARLLVPVALATAGAAVAAAVSNLVAWALVGDAAEVVAVDIAASVGRIALVVAFGGVLAVGIGLTLRSAAGTLTVIFLLVLALPIALGNTGVGWLIAVSDALPGRAIVSLLVVDQIELPPHRIVWVMVAWTAATLLAGSWSLLRRDTV